jgi:hypothetical protein
MNVRPRFARLQRVAAAVPLSRLDVASALAFLVSLALYLATLTQSHTFDALSYALDVDTKPWQELFHPHHLAYGPLGALVRALAQALGWEGRAVLPLQVANALAGALGVMLFLRLVHRLTRRLDLALCGALLLGGSYAYWYYAVEVEVYTIAAVLLVGCLALMAALLREPRREVAATLGALQGLAVLFHQTNVLLCVPVALALWLAGRQQPWAARRALWLAYGAPLALVAGGAYLLVGFGISGFRSPGEFGAWLTAYARTGWWGGPIERTQWADLERGLSSALAHPYGALLWLLLLGLVVLFLRHLLRRYRSLVLLLLAWLAVYGAFFFWWEPDNAEFWIASFPPALLLLLLALGAGGRPWHAGVWVALAVGLAMVVGNYEAVTLRGSGFASPQRQIAAELARRSEPGTFLLVPDGLQELALNYYEERTNTLALSQVLADSGGDWVASCERLRGRIEAELGRGVAVWLGDGVLEPQRIDTRYADPLLERFQLVPAQVRACFASYLPDMTAHDLGDALPTYYRLPSAGELLAGEGWDFGQSRWGWEVHNGFAEAFGFYDTDETWSFIPADDPYLLSPRVEIDTSRYWAVQVRLAKEVANREAQMFFMDETGIIEEARSVRWELANHADLKTYHLDLREHPAWTGTLAGLRLDPSTGPDDDAGERVYIAWLRLLSYQDDPPDPTD